MMESARIYRACRACGDLLGVERREYGYCSSCAPTIKKKQPAPVIHTCIRCGKRLPRKAIRCDRCRRVHEASLAAKPSEPRPMRFVAAEAEPGNSTGKERRYASMGDAENANGCWDNMVRGLEES